MNRRAFLKGLLASTAVASVLPALPPSLAVGTSADTWGAVLGPANGGFMFTERYVSVVRQQPIALSALRRALYDRWEDEEL